MPSSLLDAILTALYADDTLIAATSSTTTSATELLEHELPPLLHWAERWRIRFNTTKTQVLHVNLHQYSIDKHPISIRIGQHRVSATPFIKYLGIIFDTRLTLQPHVSSIIQRATRQFTALKHTLPSTPTSESLLLHIYKQAIRPILIYGASATSSITSEPFRQLQVRERSILRYILRRPRRTPITQLYHLAGFSPLHKIINAERRNILRKSRLHFNPLIQRLGICKDLSWEHRRPGDFSSSSSSASIASNSKDSP